MLLFMLLGIQRVLRVVKCSNVMIGLDFFFYVVFLFEDLCIVFLSEKSKVCCSFLGVVLNFWFQGNLLFILY